MGASRLSLDVHQREEEEEEESLAFNTAMLQVVGLRHLGMINWQRKTVPKYTRSSTDTGGHAIDKL